MSSWSMLQGSQELPNFNFIMLLWAKLADTACCYVCFSAFKHNSSVVQKLIVAAHSYKVALNYHLTSFFIVKNYTFNSPRIIRIIPLGGKAFLLLYFYLFLKLNIEPSFTLITVQKANRHLDTFRSILCFSLSQKMGF